jgi:hypothetical protein
LQRASADKQARQLGATGPDIAQAAQRRHQQRFPTTSVPDGDNTPATTTTNNGNVTSSDSRSRERQESTGCGEPKHLALPTQPVQQHGHAKGVTDAATTSHRSSCTYVIMRCNLWSERWAMNDKSTSATRERTCSASQRVEAHNRGSPHNRPSLQRHSLHA